MHGIRTPAYYEVPILNGPAWLNQWPTTLESISNSTILKPPSQASFILELLPITLQWCILQSLHSVLLLPVTSYHGPAAHTSSLLLQGCLLLHHQYWLWQSTLMATSNKSFPRACCFLPFQCPLSISRLQGFQNHVFQVFNFHQNMHQQIIKHPLILPLPNPLGCNWEDNPLSCI